MEKDKRVEKINKTIKRNRLIKTITWRIFAWVLTTILTWIFFDDIAKALSLGAIDVTIKLFAFYFHDLWWAKFVDKKIKKIKTKYPKI